MHYARVERAQILHKHKQVIQDPRQSFSHLFIFIVVVLGQI